MRIQHMSKLSLALTAVTALIALPLFGCGGGGGSSSAPSPQASGPLSASAVTPNGLTATLTQSVGSSVTYTLTLTNNTGQSVNFFSYISDATPASTTAIGGTLVITSPSGGDAYPPPSTGGNNLGPGAGPETTLAPGQSLSGTISPGNVFGTSGTYSATAAFSLTDVSTPTVPQTTYIGPLTVTVQ